MTSGNHIVDDIGWPKEPSDDCPACRIGSIQLLDYCPINKEECSFLCPEYSICIQAVPGQGCKRCGYAREIE